jgi:AcrR family transcriptional regulator
VTAIHPLGLRERKKAKTTTDLIDAAYALFIEKGLSGVTAEGIAERAGVSRRTFFNYFPTTEAALTRGISDSLIDLLTVGLASRPADESVLDSFEAIASGGNDPDFLRRIAQLGAAGASDPARQGDPARREPRLDGVVHRLPSHSRRRRPLRRHPPRHRHLRGGAGRDHHLGRAQ